MSTTSLVPQMLVQCAIGLPLLIVWVTAGVFVFLRMENNRMAAILALVGIALGLLNLVGGTMLNASLPAIVSQGVGAQDIGLMLSGFGIAQALLSTITWALILGALVLALGKRESPAQD